MSSRSLVLSALLLGAFAAPASAQTPPQLSALKPCYVSAGEEEDRREGVNINATGFTPMAGVEIYVDGVLALAGQADVVGTVKATVKAPFQLTGEREFAVSLVQVGDPSKTVGALTRVTSLGVTLRPREARSSQKVRFRGRGFTAGAGVYAHYVYRNRARKTVRLARRPTGPCGTFAVRRKQIPIRRPRTGQWTLQIDQQRRYTAQPATNWVRLAITLREVFDNPGR
jgi:hypothetical protein